MDSLLDPLNDRIVKTFKPPPHKPLNSEQLYPEKLKGSFFLYWNLHYMIIIVFLGKPDWKLMKDHLQKEGRISKEDLRKIVGDVSKIFSRYFSSSS